MFEVPVLWVALNSMAWGLFVSTLVPPSNSTLALAVVLLSMCVGLSDPGNISEAVGTPMGTAAKASFFTWTTGMSFLGLLGNEEGERIGMQAVFKKGYLGVCETSMGYK